MNLFIFTLSCLIKTQKNIPDDILKNKTFQNDEFNVRKMQFYNFKNPSKKIIRKEIRDLSKEELKRYKNAVHKLREENIIDDLSRLHTACEKYAHNHQRFLAWHRAYLLYYEMLLNLVSGIEKNDKKYITIPYWDWSIDSENIEESFPIKEVFPVNDTNLCFLVNFPNSHCLKRNKKIDYCYDTKQIKKILKLPFKKFHNLFETVPHAIIHLNLGGDMAMLHSCNDPLFFLHHSYCDYMWAVQQDNQENLGASDYLADFDEILFPFDLKVRDVWKSNVYYKPYKEKYFKKDLKKDLKKKNKKKDGKKLKKRKVEESKVKDIPEKFIKKHGYNKKRVRRNERHMKNKSSWLDKWLL